MKGDYSGNELVHPFALRKVDSGRYENHRVIGMIELETIPIDERRLYMTAS